MTKNSLQGVTALNNLSYPDRGLSQIKRNGHTHYGKQNYLCKNCGRQFVENSQRISGAERDLIKQLLLERLSLLGIFRSLKVSLRWLPSFIGEVYESFPKDRKVKLPHYFFMTTKQQNEHR